MRNETKKEFLINLAYGFVLLLLFYISVKFLLFYLLPFAIAIPVASLVQKPARLISKKTKLKSGTVSAFLAAVLYIITAAILVFLIYRISVAISSIMNDFPDITDRITDFFNKTEDKIFNLANRISPELSKKVALITSELSSGITVKISDFLSDFATDYAKKMPSFIFSSIVTFVASCFIAKDFNRLTKFISSLLGNRLFGNILKIKTILSSCILKLARGYLILMLITFAELTVGFLILRIKHAFLLGLLIALIDILPVFGTGAVLVPWGIISILSGNTSTGISILVLYAVITVVRNFAEPKIIGNQIGIHPLFTLIAMFIGVKVFGFAGLFILPITLIVTVKYYDFRETA